MQPQINTDYTGHWKLNELNLIINDIENAISDEISRKNIQIEDNYLNIVLRITGKAIVSMREIICLSTNGYPDGALSLARNVYEHLIIIAFFESHLHDDSLNEYICDYFLDYDIQRYKALIYEAKNCTDNIEETQRLTEQEAEIKKTAHHEVKGTYWWTGHDSFDSLVKEIQGSVEPVKLRKFLCCVHFAYKHACVSIHSNSIGNTLRLGTHCGFSGIGTSPTINGHSLPLWYATISFIYIIGITYRMLDLKFDEIDKRLRSLVEFYNKQ